MIDLNSPNHDERPVGIPVDILVLHYTGMVSGEAARQRLTDPEARVSAHYLIEENGTIYRMVDEERRAWHAGVSFWRGATDINGRSIGIELVNPGHEFGYRAFAEPQMNSLTGLAAEILSRHPIPSRNVVGHSDVAPRRKIDPGELFDWPRLAAAEIGIWPADGGADPAPSNGEKLLAEIGYDCTDQVAAIQSFQRHFTPSNISGKMDIGTRRRIADVARAVELEIS